MRSTVYMDHASVGRPATTTIEAVQQAVAKVGQQDGSGTDLTLDLVQELEGARMSASRLMSVAPESVALIENTTQGLGLLATSMPFESGDNIVVPDIDFLSAALVWRRAKDIYGIEIRAVRTKAGQVTIDDFASVVDHKTRAVVTSVVQEVSGYRVDLEGLMQLCSANGAYLIVDGIQEVGALKRDLSQTPVHAYCSGGHKWLGSPFGLGFMCVHEDLIDVCAPAFYGYFNLHEPEQGWGTYLESRERSSFDELPAIQNASSFESGGMPNWLGATGLKWAVENIFELGIRAIQSDVLALGQHLRRGLGRLGLSDHVLGIGYPDHDSGIVTFSLPGGLPQERVLFGELKKAGVFVSLRSSVGVGGIRVSPYIQNTLEDIDLLLEITRRHLEEA